MHLFMRGLAAARDCSRVRGVATSNTGAK